MGIWIKKGLFVTIVLLLMINSLYLVLAQEDTTPPEVVDKTLLRVRQLDIGSLMPLSILLIFTVFGILLFIYSKNISSKSLKTSIILPLIVWIVGIIHWIGSMFSSSITEGVLLDLGSFFMYFWLFFAPIILVAIGFSIFALVKLKEKKIPIINLVLNIIYLIIWIIFVSTVRLG